jgi:hypothetical protein
MSAACSGSRWCWLQRQPWPQCRAARASQGNVRSTPRRLLPAGTGRSGSPLPTPRAARIGVRRPRLAFEPPLALQPLPLGPPLTPGSRPSVAARVLPGHEPSSSPSHGRYARSVETSRSPGFQAVTASGRPAAESAHAKPGVGGSLAVGRAEAKSNSRERLESWPPAVR